MQILIPILGEIGAELAVNAWYVLIFDFNSSAFRLYCTDNNYAFNRRGSEYGDVRARHESELRQFKVT